MQLFRIVTMVTFAAAALGFCSATAYAGPGNINKRQARQDARVYQGVKSGSLTLGETERLDRQQTRIATREAKDRRTGGGLSSRERAQLERDLNRESRNIYQQKHDAQKRGGK